MNIEGNNITVNKSQEDLFNFLTQLENFKQLMPENTEKFEVDGESFIFGLKGMPEIRLVMKEKTEFSNVRNELVQGTNFIDSNNLQSFIKFDQVNNL